jgi:4-diphosphocytidyl-2-C-methyl-D-erythritol kinase
MKIEVKAHAKVNWTLEVLGSFPEAHSNYGFTEIKTIMVLLELHDLITIEIRDSTSGQTIISSTCESLPQTRNGLEKTNVCYQALNELRNLSPTLKQKDVLIHIDKHIPIAGGLGGSSTDGSAVLTALNEHCALQLTTEKLIGTAAKFGSDTPFFASGYRCACVSGRGEAVDELPSFPKDVNLVFLNPNRELNVTDVYKSLRSSGYENCAKLINELPPSQLVINKLMDDSNIGELGSYLYNDLAFAPFTIKRFPELPEVSKALCDLGCLGAQMSGSGSTVFGVAPDKVTALKISHELQKRYPNYLVFSSPLLN